VNECGSFEDNQMNVKGESVDVEVKRKEEKSTQERKWPLDG